LRGRRNTLHQHCLLILKGLWYVLVAPTRLILWLVTRSRNVSKEEEVDDKTGPEIAETAECPEFLQFFTKSKEIGVGLEYIEMSPDETAVIRIVGETTFSKQYRRRIYTDRLGGKYFKLNGQQYHLRRPATAPRTPTQESTRHKKK